LNFKQYVGVMNGSYGRVFSLKNVPINYTIYHLYKIPKTNVLIGETPSSKI
jgi:hypothetical protein